MGYIDGAVTIAGSAVPKVQFERCLRVLLSGEDAGLVARDEGLDEMMVSAWRRMVVGRGLKGALALWPRVVPDKIDPVIDPDMEAMVIREMIGGVSLADLNKTLAKSGYRGIDKMSYARYASHWHVKQYRELYREAAVRTGYGDRLERLAAIGRLFEGIEKRLNGDPDVKELEVCLREGRELLKQASIEVGDWAEVQHLNVDALVRSMGPAQLLAAASREDGDVIDAAYQLEESLDAVAT